MKIANVIVIHAKTEIVQTAHVMTAPAQIAPAKFY
jgi:hypothetical protein